MVKATIKADTFYIVMTEWNGKYARYVNDCAWHITDSVEAATRISSDDVETTLAEIKEAGYGKAKAVKVEQVFRLYDVPKEVGNDPDYDLIDIEMSWHPFSEYPRIAKEVIRLRTRYVKAEGNAGVQHDIKREMADVVNKYSVRGVRFCPRCNRVENGILVTPDSFGNMMLPKRVNNSYEGYECEYDWTHQDYERIEHWG